MHLPRPRWKTLLTATSVAALLGVGLVGCAADLPEDEEEGGEVVENQSEGPLADDEPTDLTPDQYEDDGEVGSVASELGGCNQCSNCVLYARCRQRRLPFGLTTYAQKVAIINSSRARAGCVAVIRTSSQWGHVAYVNRVSGSTVYLDEGNWPSGRCGRRSGTAARLNIRGYFCPR